jgi:hypothetical protein
MDSLPIEIVDYMFEFVTEPCMRMVCRFVCHQWNDVLRTFHEYREEHREKYKNLCGDAVKHKYFDILEWLRANGCPLDEDVFRYPAEQGDLETLKLLRRKGCPWSSYAINYAAGQPNIEVLEWIKENGGIFGWQAYSIAAENSNIAALDWLYEHKILLFPPAAGGAVRSGNLEVLRWFKNKRVPFTYQLVDIAAERGDYKMFKELVNASSMDPFVCTKAVKGGNLDILDYLNNISFIPDSILPNMYLEGDEVVREWLLEKRNFYYNPEVHFPISRKELMDRIKKYRNPFAN